LAYQLDNYYDEVFHFGEVGVFYVIGGITATRSSQKSTSQIPVFIVMVFYNELQNELDKDDIQMCLETYCLSCGTSKKI